MMSFNLLLIILLSHFFVQQVSGSCTRSQTDTYCVCTFKSLFKPTILDITTFNNYYNNYGSQKYKIVITDSFLPTVNSNLFGDHDIAVLEITNCNIQHLDINDLISLITIDLSHNNISTFHFFDNMEELRQINFSYNNISTVNNQLSTTSNLEEINLSHNKIIKLTDCFNEPFLIQLDLSYNYINNISKEYFNMLKILDILKISNNNITKLESGIFKNMRSLTYLDLSRNYIRILEFSSFSGLDKLKTLDLSYNYITSIPGNSFHNFHKLESLNVKGNQLTKLETEDILDTIALTSIDFDENPMSCEMISHLLKQFRKNNVEVVLGSSHGNSSIYGIKCVKGDELIASNSENLIQFIQKFYADFKKSGFMTFFQEIQSNLNSSIIQDIVENMISPEEKSNIKRVLGNFTDLIERNDKIVQNNQMNIKKYMDDVQINLKNNLNIENDLLKNISTDIAKNAENTKDVIIKITEEMKSIYNVFSRDSIQIVEKFVANEEKKIKNEEDIKEIFQKMMTNFEAISNMYSKINNSNNDTKEIWKKTSDTISMPAIFISIAILLVVISGILIAQIVFKMHVKKKYNRKILQNELQSIG